jgi:hypothetical protein
MTEQLAEKLQAAKTLPPGCIGVSGKVAKDAFEALKWAEGLILQLPEHHNGRNSWLLNYGLSEEAKIIQEIRRERDEANGQFGVGA